MDLERIRVRLLTAGLAGLSAAGCGERAGVARREPTVAVTAPATAAPPPTTAPTTAPTAAPTAEAIGGKPGEGAGGKESSAVSPGPRFCVRGDVGSAGLTVEQTSGCGSSGITCDEGPGREGRAGGERARRALEARLEGLVCGEREGAGGAPRAGAELHEALRARLLADLVAPCARALLAAA